LILAPARKPRRLREQGRLGRLGTHRYDEIAGSAGDDVFRVGLLVAGRDQEAVILAAYGLIDVQGNFEARRATRAAALTEENLARRGRRPERRVHFTDSFVHFAKQGAL
jgi:hypothetical protein